MSRHEKKRRDRARMIELRHKDPYAYVFGTVRSPVVILKRR